jgi:hypothetical protein
MAAAGATLQQSLAAGQIPEPSAWQALLGAGYTTAEQRAVARPTPAPATPATRGETTFF